MLQEAKDMNLKSEDSGDAKQNVCEAAIRCFKQYGPQRTSMADIAEEAGISRKTLYRIFDDRPALIEYILQQRMITLGDKVRKKLSGINDFEEAIVEGSIYSLRVSREDNLFNEIIKRDTNHRIELFLFGPRDQIKTAIVDLWSGVIRAGRKQALVRSDLSDERIVELLANVHSLLLIRDDYDEADQRKFLNDFLLPALKPQ